MQNFIPQIQSWCLTYFRIFIHKNDLLLAQNLLDLRV